MYLKKLALAGFKSFAEPVELDFLKGVSAIVGPNGSGKSNITDAIRWVLGEQSTKSLRGKKMEDVIFSGTEKKQALGYAEVTLTLDNTSGFIKDNLDEIAITRRLFRSGDSEYRMNQKNCKLKDIHELFMDTGLGKNGYSLISQGGIENIINSSPQELRGIVEEAVGIVNYKTKKQEAEKKLENTQNNLERLKDILEEIEKQLKPLKAQSEKAKEYLELREALKKVDLLVFHANMKESGDKLAAYEKQLSQLKFELFEIEKKASEKDKAFQNARGSIRGITEQAEALSQELEQFKKRIGEYER
ncbi:MAG: AAA family ATPase, partial [Eubacterium sp.]